MEHVGLCSQSPALRAPPQHTHTMGVMEGGRLSLCLCEGRGWNAPDPGFQIATDHGKAGGPPPLCLLALTDRVTVHRSPRGVTH